MELNRMSPRARANASDFSYMVIDQSGELGGAELALLPLLEHWGDRCQTVLFDNGPFAERVAALGVNMSVLVEARLNSVRKRGGRLQRTVQGVAAMRAIRRQIDSLTELARRTDIVYANTQKALVLGAIAAKRAGKPVIWHAHDIMSRAHFSALQLMIVRQIVRSRVDHVIANSNASARAIQTLTGIAPDRIDVLPNGIAAAPFESVTSARCSALRKSIGIGDDVFVAGIFGRLAKWKGVHVALDAIALQPLMHLVVVGGALFGEHAYAAQLQKRVAELGLDSRVHFVGFSNDVPAWMKAVDVVLHASVSPEPFGRVVVEGMLARRPVIATAAGGVTDIISHRENGVLVAPGDPFALADALAAVASSPVWARSLGDRASEDASQRYRLDVYVQSVSQIVLRVATHAVRSVASYEPLHAEPAAEAAA